MTAALALLLLTPQEAPSRDEALKALHRAVEFFRTKVAVQGGYVWRASEDLALREGEGACTATMAWVQPPGTPSVGMAYLEAWRATGDRTFLEAARETAGALVRGQLRSGGWTYSIEFDPEKRRRIAYRADPDSKGANVSTLDDNTTQAALLLLVRADQALEFKDGKVHEAALAGLEALLKAQYPNGGWPQRFDGPSDASRPPDRRASFPETWPRKWPAADYRSCYTLNDNLIDDALDVLLEAARVYGEGKYRQAALRAGDFLILAQMPDPQPAWAQQYDAEMRPAWARKFEPPSVTGGESQGAMGVLLRLYRETGERKYLEPVPRALDYLRRSRLADGALARFYELGTNAPLYFTKDYELTQSDEDLPTHYSFKPASRLDRIAEEFERLKAADPASLRPAEAGKPRLTKAVADEARRAVEALDDQGRWVTPGRIRTREDVPVRRIVDSRVFIRNVEALSRYLAATKP